MTQYQLPPPSQEFRPLFYFGVSQYTWTISIYGKNLLYYQLHLHH